MAANQLLYWALNNKNVKCAWVSPVYKQSKKVFQDIYKAFAKRPEIYKTVNQSDLLLEYVTGSTIQFFSAERYDNIRGFTFDYLVCDEFAFMQAEAWTEVLRATVLVKGKKVLLISTPKGKNHFYTMHQMDGINPQYKSFTMTSYDNPIIQPSEIDDAKYTLPEIIFKQEYLAEFVDGGYHLFSNIPIGTGERTSRLVAGLDLGRADDYTVLTIMNDKGQMVFCERWRQMEWATILNHVKTILRDFRPDVYVEVNSIGDIVLESLRNDMSGICNIHPFVTTSKSKNDIIESLLVASQNKEVSILDLDWLRKEFEVFSFEYNPKSRLVKYSAPAGFHDDGVMATAICYQAYKDFAKGGRYMLL